MAQTFAPGALLHDGGVRRVGGGGEAKAQIVVAVARKVVVAVADPEVGSRVVPGPAPGDP
ncbi:MAG: hypothetical protein HQL76_05735 [Magnetococcales bacterium]|nr:hypothetical protein [Magnetococcales bacterium]